MENIGKLDKKKCTGCRTCEMICPVNAIKMIENEEGFLEPKLDKEKCINCGLCYKKCPQINDIKIETKEEKKVIAAKNINTIEQLQGSSGGIFSVIANYILENNGVIYGCAFNEEIVAEHIRISNKRDLDKLKGSKYVQSDVKKTFVEVKKDLENNIQVLYSGTPCQIAGLKSFLGKNYKNLITVDLICHGVPSPKLLKRQVEEIEKKSKSKVKKLEFRNKEKYGWGSYGFYIEFENGKKKYIPLNLNPYLKSFLKGKLCRYCCYECKYSNDSRIGDITVGDYWGIQHEHPDFFDEKGVSVVLINTDKGQEIFENIKNEIIYIESSIDKAKKKNHNLNRPTDLYYDRDNVYKGLEKKYNKYVKDNLKCKILIIDRIKQVIPQKIKDKIKKILRKV